MYDVVIIGGGPGGYVAAIRAAQLGLKTALVERDRVGGVCLNWGCIPTKALIRNADIVNAVKQGDYWGISFEGIRFDYSRAHARSREVVDRLVRGVEFLLKRHGVEVLAGEGFVAERNRVVVRPEGRELETKNIIVATGGSPRTLPGLQPDGRRVLTSYHALNLQELPRSMVIVGGGAVGVEFAYIFSAYGVEVTVVEMLPRLVPQEDEEVSAELERAFKKQGIKVMTGTRVEGAEVTDSGVTLQLSGPEGRSSLAAEQVLLGIGIVPNTAGLGLEEVGVELDRGWVKIDERMRTNVPGIWAIGDVTGKLALAHVASHQGIVAVETIAGLNPPPIKSYADMPRCTYCNPQVASVGLTEAQAREAGYQVRVGKFPFRANGKALGLGEAEGFVKIVSDADYGEVLGIHMVGPEVTELISEGVVGRLLEGTPKEFGWAVHPHPTLSEAVKEAALAVYGEAIHFFTGTAAGRPAQGSGG
jgi:dihydrolipoamide dehydrogenase